jgi:hypothetical protein
MIYDTFFSLYLYIILSLFFLLFLCVRETRGNKLCEMKDTKRSCSEMGKKGGKQQCCQQVNNARHRERRRNSPNHSLPPRNSSALPLPSSPRQGLVNNRAESTARLNRAVQASLLARQLSPEEEFKQTAESMERWEAERQRKTELAFQEQVNERAHMAFQAQANLQPSGQHRDEGSTTFRAAIASHDARLQMLEAQAAIERNPTPHRTAPALGPRSWSFQYLADHSICLSWLATGEEQSQRPTPHHFFNSEAFPSLVRALEAAFPSTTAPRK